MFNGVKKIVTILVVTVLLAVEFISDPGGFIEQAVEYFKTQQISEISQNSNDNSFLLDDIDIDVIPDYCGNLTIILNEGRPFFLDEPDEMYETTVSYEYYAPLDSLGRCTRAEANLGMDLMPKEDRGDISNVKPSGWWNKPYDFVDGGYLYNRSHLIAFMLAGENDNERNLITGTRYLNATGMLPYEDMVHDYIVDTNNHVLYRVTPIYDGDNLIADGVIMEAYSVEDKGEGVEFCVFVYNVQPGVIIDYLTGDNWAAGYSEGE